MNLSGYTKTQLEHTASIAFLKFSENMFSKTNLSVFSSEKKQVKIGIQSLSYHGKQS